MGLRSPAQARGYLKGIVGAFANDSRLLGWDLWNQPNNGGGNYKPTPHKNDYVARLLPQVFAWARSVDPAQPLTSGVWIGEDWRDVSKRDATEKTLLTQSDVLTFHDYNWPETFEQRARQMLSYGRPVICTEYTYDEPTQWFHEVFRGDGTPYRQAEVDLIKRLAPSPKGIVPATPAAK